MKKHNLTTLSVLSLCLAACGGKGGAGGSGPAEEVRENQVAEGQYHSFIRPLNTHTFGRINSGALNATINGEFKVSLYMDDAPPITHTQAIFTGTRCPDLTEDTNGDGHIDILEASKVIGKMLIPLDNDISSQGAGAGFYPSGMAYMFRKSTSLETLMTDLKATDIDPDDHIVKLRPDENLNLEGRVVVIMGAPTTANLPTTVKTVKGMTNYQSLPISCGVIERVAETN
jgi:hypothetical protein